MFQDLVTCRFNPGTMYVILCSRFIVSSAFYPGSMYVILCSRYSIPPLWQRPNVCCSMFQDLVSYPFDPVTMYVILCSRFNKQTPLIPAHCMLFYVPNVLYPAPSTPAQCMLFYVPDIVSRPFNSIITSVILCSKI